MTKRTTINALKAQVKKTKAKHSILVNMMIGCDGKIPDDERYKLEKAVKDAAYEKNKAIKDLEAKEPKTEIIDVLPGTVELDDSFKSQLALDDNARMFELSYGSRKKEAVAQILGRSDPEEIFHAESVNRQIQFGMVACASNLDEVGNKIGSQIETQVVPKLSNLKMDMEVAYSLLRLKEMDIKDLEEEKCAVMSATASAGHNTPILNRLYKEARDKLEEEKEPRLDDHKNKAAKFAKAKKTKELMEHAVSNLGLYKLIHGDQA